MSTLKAAHELVLEQQYRKDPNIIPPIKHPLGNGWQQPARHEIRIDSEFAYMSQATFDKLAEYSCSTPTGVYEGKMWKSNPHKYYPQVPDQWFLLWFGYSDKPDHCSINRRIIVLENFLDYQI